MLARRSFSRRGVASDRLQIKRTRASATSWITGWTSWDSEFIGFTTFPNALIIIVTISGIECCFVDRFRGLELSPDKTFAIQNNHFKLALGVKALI